MKTEPGASDSHGVRDAVDEYLYRYFGISRTPLGEQESPQELGEDELVGRYIRSAFGLSEQSD